MSFPRVVVLWLVVFGLTGIMAAGPFSNVVVYGDSLSDTGNLFGAVGEPAPPYFMGRASNGYLAVELLANTFGAPLVNFAWGGATTGIGNHLDPGGTATSVGTFGLPGMSAMYASSVTAVTPLAPSSLFVVWGGPDDFLSPSPLDPTGLAVADRAVDNLVAIVTGLKSLGAQHILVPGMPDLGLTPFKLLEGPLPAAQATAVSDYFNQRLRAALPDGVVFFDTAALLRTVVDDPSAFGFTNVTEACLDTTAPSLCGTPNQYLFWDDIHPSARGHEILAARFAASAVPEPNALALSLSGLIALGLISRSRQILSARRRR